MSRSYLKMGSWNAICDRCGRKFKAHELRKTWDGLMVCSYDWETRHPQELIRGVKDVQGAKWTKPQPADTFVNVCTLSGRLSIAGYGTAGCMIAGYVPNNWRDYVPK